MYCLVLLPKIIQSFEFWTMFFVLFYWLFWIHFYPTAMTQPPGLTETTAADQQHRDLPKQQKLLNNKQQQHNKQQRQQQHLNKRQQHQVDLPATATWATDSSVLRRMSSTSIQTIARNISGLMIILLTFLKISSKK